MSSSADKELILNLLREHALHDAQSYYAYGTAGFRFPFEWMDGIMLRVGLVARLLLQQEDMGCMVTASHNDESYNGVKLSSPDGSMVSATQEATLVKWVNETSLEEWTRLLDSLANDSNSTTPSQAIFHVGYDTRSHSPRLAGLVVKGAQAMGVTVQNHGVLTTPMLHHVVLHSNPKYLPPMTTPAPTREGYIQSMACAFCQALDVCVPNHKESERPPCVVDGACGVGYAAVKELAIAISQRQQIPVALLEARNAPGEGPLNRDCGSEHVQKELKAPTWWKEGTPTPPSLDYCCSLDGDADRIVFFSIDAAAALTLLDGDKMSVLIADFFQAKLQEAYKRQPELQNISMGVVQTAYANGASTSYLKAALQTPVTITKTGVKHLHHAAMKYDIGIYFEANGHGTVLFSGDYWKFAQACQDPTFSLLPKFIHPAVGDALSDLLLVDLLLQAKGWTLQDWATKLYTDLQSRQLKIKVEDRSLVTCNDNETQCLQPAGLQDLLDQAMKAESEGRCFVRASGTENVVRVYAEATTREAADRLALQAVSLVYEHCRGVGPLPQI